MPVQTIDPTLPEPVRRFLESGARLEAIVLDDEGEWHHEGGGFENERLKALFHRSIRRTPGGTWVLDVPPFTYPIQVADTPYHVRSLRIEGEGPDERVVMRLSDDTEEVLAPGGLRHVEGRGFYCAVKDGAFQARFNRAATFALAPRLEGEEGSLWLRLGAGRTLVATS